MIKFDETFEKALRLMSGALAVVGECYAFKNNWSEEYQSKEIHEYFNTHKQSEEFWKKVFNLPEKEKVILGFRYFEKDNPKMNIPIWIWNLLPDNMYIEDGGKTVKELDNDTRFGVVYWKV